ncbi:MAG: hypothetical protein J0M12_17890 [Deltaproteobacteria bacterium]|nr:hypothetical protein [Deltaproteobacteria bacterium]
MRLVVLLALVVALLIGVTPSFAAQSLGSGYACKSRPAPLSGLLMRKVGTRLVKIDAKATIKLIKQRIKNSRGAAKRAHRNLLAAMQGCVATVQQESEPPAPTIVPTVAATANPPAAPVDYCADKKIFWNVGSQAPQSPFDLSAMPHIQKNLILINMGWFGAFPDFMPANQEQINRVNWLQIPYSVKGGILYVNSGTPLYGSLEANTEAIARHIVATVPDPAYNGYVVFDFESWFPAWELTQPEMRAEALAQFAAQNPGLGEAAIERGTQELWDEKALAFYVQTAALTKQLRPNAKLGFYDLVSRQYWQGYADPVRGDLLRAWNNKALPVHQLCDFVIADIYQFYRSALDSSGFPLPEPPSWIVPPNGTLYFAGNKRYVEENVNEALRLAAAAGDKPVMAYAWHRYHNSGGPLDAFYLVNPPDLFLQTVYPLMLGAKMITFWGDEIASYQISPLGGLQPYINNVMGPMVEGYCNGNLGPYAPLAELTQANSSNS